jgi:hypothetical protein
MPTASQRRISRVIFEHGGERFTGKISGATRVFAIEHCRNVLEIRARSPRPGYWVFALESGRAGGNRRRSVAVVSDTVRLVGARG